MTQYHSVYPDVLALLLFSMFCYKIRAFLSWEHMHILIATFMVNIL